MAIDKALLKKYNVHGPRYTSYPPATQFTKEFTQKNYYWHVESSNEDPLPKPLSIYIHLPFCEALCYYCGCHKFIAPQTSTVTNYLDNLKHEIEMQAALFNDDRKVQQIHLGGGTPTYLSTQHIQSLIAIITENFVISGKHNFECAIEIDPRTTSNKDIKDLASIGFNRMSFGVQDFDPAVQKAINRVQPKEKVTSRLQAARDAGIRSISVDLIYGLPKQSLESFDRTLEAIIEIKPERIALYNYAHMPDLIKSQRLINAKELPDTNTKVELMAMSIQRLLDAGYIHIGMDHFALPNDNLSESLVNHTLHRNFQGYSTHGDCDLIGFGVSAISHIGDCYSQNTKVISEYKRAIESNTPPISRGYNLSKADVIRTDAIQQLMCNRSLNLDEFGYIHGINARLYFAKELQALSQMATEGLVVIDNNSIKITDNGCLFLRNIAMIFDDYLQSALEHESNNCPPQKINTSELTQLHSSKKISFSKVL